MWKSILYDAVMNYLNGGYQSRKLRKKRKEDPEFDEKVRRAKRVKKRKERLDADWENSVEDILNKLDASQQKMSDAIDKARREKRNH